MFGVGLDCLNSYRSQPIKVTSKNDGKVYDLVVRCGHCINCRKYFGRIWSQRLEMESKYWRNMLFVTLTYNNDSVPYQYYIDDDFILKNMSLLDSEISNYVKRVRKNIGNYSELHKNCRYDFTNHEFITEDYRPMIKYFGCGEYGSLTQRPHYHILFFGLPYNRTVVQGLEDSWQGRGFVKVTRFVPETCYYVAGYINKKLYRNSDMILYKFPEYNRQSMFIGYSWLRDNISAVDEDNFCIYHNGFASPIGRQLSLIYRDYCGIESPDLQEVVQNKKIEFFELRKHLLSADIDYEDYFRYRAKIAQEKIKKSLAKRKEL